MTTTGTPPTAPAPHAGDSDQAGRTPSIEAVLAGCVVVAVAVMVACLWVGDGRPVSAPAGLLDAGPLTGWGLPTARVLADLAGVMTVGLLVVGSMLVGGRKGSLVPSGARWTRLATWTALAWALAVVAEIVLTLSDLLGTPVGDVLDTRLLWSFVTDIDLGRALLVQAVLALAAALVAALATTRSGAALGLVLAAAAWLPPTITGHSGASDLHDLAVSSLMVHVVGMALWCGTLAAALLLVAHERATFGRALPRLSLLATWCVVAVGASGAANALVRVSSVDDLFDTSYGRLVLLKIAGLAVLVGFGAWQRRGLRERVAANDGRAFLRIGAAEVLTMAALIGLAVALSRTPPPVDDEAGLVGATNARLLLGFDLPPAPNLTNLLWGEARLDGFTIAVGILLGALYAAGIRTLHRRGDRWPLGRTVLWFSGLLVFIVVTNIGLATYAQVMFSAHMVVHMILSMVVPIMLVLGAPITLALRALPAGQGDRGPREWLLSALHSPVVRFFANPIVATTIFVASFYILYFTPLFDTLMRGHWGHLLMTAHFVLSGALFFWVLIGIDPGPKRPPYIARVVILLIAIPLHAFFALAVMASTTVIAGEFYTLLERPFATDLLADQGLGGGISWAMGEIPIIAVMVAIFLQWRRSDERLARAADRAADRAERDPSAPDAHADYNAYLQALADRDAHER